MTLKKFEGKEVSRATIAVTKAGDGLSAALSVDPTEYGINDRVYVVLETHVGKVTHLDDKDRPNALIRQHTLVTEHAAIVDGQVVAELLAETKQKVLEKKEADERERGIERLPGTSATETGRGRRKKKDDDTDDEASE